MSSINDEQTLITFEELKHLEMEDIAICIDKYQALKICEKSSAQAEDIYNLWTRKLFRSYGPECSDKDWVQIVGYMEQLLEKFIQNLSNSKDDSSFKQLTQWWTDTQEFLKWLQSIIADLDIRILCLILAFGFEVVLRTCKIEDKRNSQPIIKIQQLLMHILTNNALKLNLKNIDDIKGLNKVLTSLCEVASIISSSDIKLSIETWRIVAKISGKCSESFQEIKNECKDTMNELRRNSTEIPIIGIIAELHKLFKYFLEDDSALNNDNFLKVAQFYLKLVKIIMKNTQTFPSVKEFFEIYTTFIHKLKSRTKSKIVDSIQKDLNDILAIINQQGSIENYICQHLSDDNNEFVSCDLILEYMRICLDGNVRYCPDVQVSNRIFNIAFEGPLIFVDNDKYTKVILYYAALTAENESGELHMLLCNNVLESSWIKAYVSCEILRIYYGYLFKVSDEEIKNCLEFWMQCWEKFNNKSAAAQFNHQKYLAQLILKTIITLLPSSNLEQYIQKCANWEIILLLCGSDNMKYISYLNKKLTNYLKKLNDMKMVRKEYTELLNCLDIWCCHRQFVNVGVLKDELIKAFLCIFSLTLSEMQKFRDFISKCFCIFKNLNNTDVDNTILKCLQDNLNKTKVMIGAFMLEYLLDRKPQSEMLLRNLQTPEINKLQKFLETSAAKPLVCKTKNLQIFQEVYNKSMGKSKQVNPLEDIHVSKRPRVAASEGYSKDYKFILNEMLEHSHQLINNTTMTVFDTKDYELLNCIKNNIDKCLMK